MRDAAVLFAKRLRHQLRRAAATRTYGRSMRAAPVLFANSFPKSGTHLLTQVLHGFSRLGPAVDSGLPAYVMFAGSSGAPVPTSRILKALAWLRPGDIAYGHLHALPEITSRLCRDGVALFFLYRDPRDAAVSHVHYVTEIETTHAHHAYYRSLPDFDARLRASILGRPEMGDLFPDIRRRFEPFFGWLDQPENGALKFEDLVNDRENTLRRILEYAVGRGFPLAVSPSAALESLAAGIRPERSPTFRSGTAGGWRSSFSPEHTALFTEVAGDLLERLGYDP